MQRDSSVSEDWFGRVRFAVNLGAGVSERAGLASNLDGLRLPLTSFRWLARGFMISEDWESAAAVLDAAARMYPDSWHVDRLREEVEGSLAEQVERPPALNSDLLVATSAVLPGSAAELKAALDTLLAQEDWLGVNALVRKVRATPPDWINTVHPLLEEAEAREAAGQQHWIRVRQLAPALLRRDPIWRDWLAVQAETVAASGNAAFARSLIDLVVRENAAHPHARRLLREWAEADEAAGP